MLVTLQGLFTPGELDAIEAYGESLMPMKADSPADQARITRVAWMKRGPEAEWLHGRIEKTVLEMNSRLYKYDLYGLKESFQYSVYESAEGGHYHWHVDTSQTVERKHPDPATQRKTLVYEGGDLIASGRRDIHRQRAAARWCVPFLYAPPGDAGHRGHPQVAGGMGSPGPPYR